MKERREWQCDQCGGIISLSGVPKFCAYCRNPFPDDIEDRRDEYSPTIKRVMELFDKALAERRRREQKR